MLRTSGNTRTEGEDVGIQTADFYDLILHKKVALYKTNCWNLKYNSSGISLQFQSTNTSFNTVNVTGKVGNT